LVEWAESGLESPQGMGPLAFKDIQDASQRIGAFVHRTPVLTSSYLDGLTGGRLFFKCENLQKTGSFKARGAHNAVFMLEPGMAARGVVTHSSGNHAAALSLAARRRGISARVVMPSNAPAIKKAAVAGYGAVIIECEPTLTSREATTSALVAATGAQLIHPYDDHRVIAGQGTAALELLEDQPGLDCVLVPVGGGGLLAGTAIAAKGMRRGIKVIGVEPEQADDACRSFRTGIRVGSDSPVTIADGLRASLGEKAFPIVRQCVDDVVTVTESGIASAMRLIWERMKVVVEPSSAVPLAGILEGRIAVEGRSVGIILTGGNVALDALPWQGQARSPATPASPA
jgi:threonine dehydratase